MCTAKKSKISTKKPKYTYMYILAICPGMRGKKFHFSIYNLEINFARMRSKFLSARRKAQKIPLGLGFDKVFS